MMKNRRLKLLSLAHGFSIHALRRIKVISTPSNDSQPNCMPDTMTYGTPVVMGDLPPINE